jgi:DNA end-binding protein Ku
MPARAIWTGSIGFGLVNVPVRLYPATRRQVLRFHEVDRLTGQRIRHQRVRAEGAVDWPPAAAVEPARGVDAQSPASEEPELQPAVRQAESARELPRDQNVARADVLKAFSVSAQRVVTLSQEEIDVLAPQPTREIEIVQFVESAAIDPIFFETSYYVVPSRDAIRAFGLLTEAMRAAGRTAISWIVLRRRRHLAALRAYGSVMLLTTMLHADEVLPMADLEPLPPADLSGREREMAALLVNTLSGPFEPERYRDEYRDRLRELIDRRAPAAAPAPQPAPGPTGVEELMALLRASVDRARQQKARPASTPRRKIAGR